MDAVIQEDKVCAHLPASQLLRFRQTDRQERGPAGGRNVKAARAGALGALWGPWATGISPVVRNQVYLGVTTVATAADVPAGADEGLGTSVVWNKCVFGLPVWVPAHSSRTLGHC